LKQAACEISIPVNSLEFEVHREHRNADDLNIIVPFFAPRVMPHTPQDWNYTTTSQNGFDGRSVTYNSGFGLGGSSSVSKSGSLSYAR
jgi:hypothetical protein